MAKNSRKVALNVHGNLVSKLIPVALKKLTNILETKTNETTIAACAMGFLSFSKKEEVTIMVL